MYIYTFLHDTSFGVIFFSLFMLTFGAMFVGRHYFEGVPYQVSYSAHIGDAGLLAVILVAAEILKRTGVPNADWIGNATSVNNTVVFSSLVVLGVIVALTTKKMRSAEVMDYYHDVVIAPVVAYCALTLLPVIFGAGSSSDCEFTFGLIVFWAICVEYDIREDRMNQRRLLTRLGLRFKE